MAEDFHSICNPNIVNSCQKCRMAPMQYDNNLIFNTKVCTTKNCQDFYNKAFAQLAAQNSRYDILGYAKDAEVLKTCRSLIEESQNNALLTTSEKNEFFRWLCVQINAIYYYNSVD